MFAPHREHKRFSGRGGGSFIDTKFVRDQKIGERQTGNAIAKPAVWSRATILIAMDELSKPLLNGSNGIF